MKLVAANKTFCTIHLAAWCCVADAFAPSTIGLGLASPPPSNTIMYDVSSQNNDEQSTCMAARRRILIGAINSCFIFPSLASASNLPGSTGADLSKTGSVETLAPVVAIQRSLSSAKSQLSRSDGGSSSIVNPGICSALLNTLLKYIPREEREFKRIFDSYSTPVSYKQKFLDQNAFLVYYTKGFDGPGRPNIEEDDTNSMQTLQYGSRNDAWAAMDDLFVELEFGQNSKGDENASSSKEDVIALFDKVLAALDSYLRLAPAVDLEEASRQLGQ